MNFSSLALLVFASFLSCLLNADVRKLEYPQWKIVFDCEKKGVKSYHYRASKTDSDHPVSYKKFDKAQLPEKCLGKVNKRYRDKNGLGEEIIRGKVIDQKIMDFNPRLQKAELAQITYIPFEKTFYQDGLWKKTVDLVHCLKRYSNIQEWGGVLFQDANSMDITLAKYGIKKPDSYWKVIMLPGGEYRAWVLPNEKGNSQNQLVNYEISLKNLALIKGIKFDYSELENEEEIIDQSDGFDNCMG